MSKFETYISEWTHVRVTKDRGNVREEQHSKLVGLRASDQWKVVSSTCQVKHSSLVGVPDNYNFMV
jgi:hypothetical protein